MSTLSWQRFGRFFAKLAVVAYLASGSATAGATTLEPIAPPTSTGSYIVTYAPCPSCISTWLEERAEGGAWTYVSSGALTVTGKAAGTYYYRVGYVYMVDPSYFYTDFGYSSEARVVVTADASPLVSLNDQLQYRYEARYGDGNGDGRLDLFVERITGGAVASGAIDTVLLAQDGNSRFTVTVPSATQKTLARSWPVAPVEVTLEDFNVDGSADLLLKRVATALGNVNAVDQIVFAPGLGSQTPKGVRAVDAALKRFTANARDYLVNSNYFVEAAPVTTYWQVVYYSYCSSSYDFDYYYGTSCGYFAYSIPVSIRDYSGFDANALNAFLQEAAIAERRVTQAQGVDAIKRSFEDALGTPIGGRNFGTDRGEQGTLDVPGRRGFELFVAVLGLSEANAQELSPAREKGRRPEVVYVTGRKILGFLPRHTALEYNGSTISAYDNNPAFLDDGVLVSEVNWPNDDPALMMTLGTVSSGLGPALYWQRLIGADARYRDNLPYDAIPSVGVAGYNSNGYVHGIVRATGGIPSIDLTRFVGGEKPVPSTVFY